jgi:hypothetical protein
MFRAIGLAAILILAIPAATRLAVVTAPETVQLTPHDWLGVWRKGQDVVWISQNPDDLVTVVSAAYSPGTIGQRRNGTRQFEAMLDGNRIRYADDMSPCTADMLNVGGQQLIVEDNGHCGPVPFAGVYTHQ